MADIVSVPALNVDNGLIAVGAAYALETSAAVINAAWNQGNAKQAAFEAKIDAIADEATGWLSQQAAPTITAGAADAPTITEPPVDIPATQSAGDVMALFDTKYAEIIATLTAKFTAFRTDYFPDEGAAYTAAEDWLQSALASETGLPTTVAAAVMADDEARILKEASRASDTVLAQFAARRFPLPPGAAASAVLQIQQNAQDKLAESSRKITLMSVEQFRFLIQQTLGLRQSAMDAAVKYITALASGPAEIASQLVNVGYDAQSKLISAASQFYNSRTAAAEAVSKVQQFNVSTALDAASKNQAAELTLIEDRLKALLTECQALAQMATSLFNNVHASAGTSYSIIGN